MNKNEENDKLTLVDFVAVIIRYRKFIALSTIIMMVLSCVYYYGYKSITEKNIEKEVSIIYNVDIEKITPELSSYLNLDLLGFCEKELKSYVNFSYIHKDFNVFCSSDLDTLHYNYTIKKIIDESKVFSVIPIRINNTIQISATVPESKEEELKSFMPIYIEYCSSLVDSSVLKMVDSAKVNLDEIINKTENNDKNTSDLSNLISIRLGINEFIDNHRNIISLKGNSFDIEVFIMPKSKKVFTITFATLIAAVIFSFVLNGIYNLKQDEKECKKIKDAWKAGK